MPTANPSEASLIDRCLRGEQLYGDDFPREAIEAWFHDEEEAYFRLFAAVATRQEYEYYSLNWEHGYRHLPPHGFQSVLGVGSALGSELVPIARRSQRITILEPARGFVAADVDGTPVTFVAPRASGELPFADGSFDLITCLGVLHHIPNVSTLLRGFSRCLRPGGHALIREPVVSMGDWRHPRHGLTSRERGIPLAIFRRIIADSGLTILRERKCMFSLTPRLKFLLNKPVYNSRAAVRLDEVLCRLPFWSRKYHAVHPWEKLRPTCVFYVLRKPA